MGPHGSALTLSPSLGHLGGQVLLCAKCSRYHPLPGACCEPKYPGPARQNNWSSATQLGDTCAWALSCPREDDPELTPLPQASEPQPLLGGRSSLQAGWTTGAPWGCGADLRTGVLSPLRTGLGFEDLPGGKGQEDTLNDPHHLLIVGVLGAGQSRTAGLVQAWSSGGALSGQRPPATALL